MGSITKSYVQNLGGIAQLYYVEADNVLLIPETDGMAYPSDIVLAVGQYWNRIEFTSQTVTPVITNKEGVHGPYYEATIKGIIPHDSRENLLALGQMHELIIAYLDMEGNMKIIGTAETPVKALFSHTNPAQTRGRKGFAFEFAYKGLLPALFYDGELSDNPVFLPQFSFQSDSLLLNLQFEGTGEVYIQFEEGITQTFMTGEPIIYAFETMESRTINVRFEDKNSITEIIASANAISDTIYMTLLPALQLADFSNNELTVIDMEAFLSLVDNAGNTDLIISLYGNAVPNAATIVLINNLTAKNIAVELAFLGLVLDSQPI